jgi:hypothetical protein
MFASTNTTVYPPSDNVWNIFSKNILYVHELSYDFVKDYKKNILNEGWTDRIHWRTDGC